MANLAKISGFEDRVHPNHAGYLLRVQIMRPLLGEPDQKP